MTWGIQLCHTGSFLAAICTLSRKLSSCGSNLVALQQDPSSGQVGTHTLTGKADSQLL